MNGTFFCNKCGAQNTAGAQFCSRCGAPMSPTPAVPGVVPSTAPPPPYPISAPSYPGVAPVAGVGYGGFWIRVVAAIIDSIILSLVLIPAVVIFGGLGAAGMLGGAPHFSPELIAGVRIPFLFVAWLYEALLESSSYQATLGKMMLGMKVTDLYGNRLSFGRATGRHFAKWLSRLTLGIGYIMVGFTERKQGLHDLLAGTLVRRQ
jgi:uncharacterized RDD family membrane protein YckC